MADHYLACIEPCKQTKFYWQSNRDLIPWPRLQLRWL